MSPDTFDLLWPDQFAEQAKQEGWTLDLAMGEVMVDGGPLLSDDIRVLNQLVGRAMSGDPLATLALRLIDNAWDLSRLRQHPGYAPLMAKIKERE